MLSKHMFILCGVDRETFSPVMVKSQLMFDKHFNSKYILRSIL